MFFVEMRDNVFGRMKKDGASGGVERAEMGRKVIVNY